MLKFFGWLLAVLAWVLSCGPDGTVCDICFLVTLKDVTVASTPPVKTNTDTQTGDESAGGRGMERLQCF